jgi:two-component system sensor histidine kinase YesM
MRTLRLFKNLFDKVYEYFANMRLLRKLTLAYLVAILIPTVIIGSFTYFQSMEYIKKEAVQNAEKSIMQIKGDLERRIALIKGVANNIAFNRKIQNLLYYRMEFTPDVLDYFINSIAAPIDYTLNFNDANIYRIGVYHNNNTIPEYSNFFNEAKIKDEDWYESFIKSDMDELWIYPAASKRFTSGANAADADKDDKGSNSSNSNEIYVVKMVRKIRAIDKKYLGVVIIEISEKDMFSSMNVAMENDEIFIANDAGGIIFPRKYDDIQMHIKLQNIYIEDEKGYSFYRDNLYRYELIEPLNFKIISKISIGNLFNNTFKTSGLFVLGAVLGVIILEIFTYFILKIIFSRLNQIVKIMDMVAKGNFNIRLPNTHKDEVGHITESFNTLIQKINGLVSDLIKKETAHKDAQLTALQYQINPHFIYNTIDNFRMKLELEGNYSMAESVTDFGKILRYNINRDSKFTTIKEEIDYIEKYIKLQKLRFGEKIKFKVCSMEEFGDIQIIRFILQPIIENSIMHGMDPSKKELYIQIEFFKQDSHVQIHVTDNGIGIAQHEIECINNRFKNSKDLESISNTDKYIGLANINARLKLFFGDQYYIRMESKEREYTRTIINIPYNVD